MRRAALTVSTLLVALLPSWSFGQDAAPSAEDFAKALLGQAGAAQKTRSLGGTACKTRGLMITPGSDAVHKPLPQDPTRLATVPAEYCELPEGQQINIRIGFAFDSAVLAPAEAEKLVNLCTAMRAVQVARFQIIGHSDASGPEAYNLSLSVLRAEEVRRHLVATCGLPAERLEAIGVGEGFPADPADPRADANRRVEFQALG
jgi:outer membrane protein OmpA-like peptidoglycan-associated protein